MIVYRHRRLDTYEVFYVGIGVRERRAYNKCKRSLHWKRVVAKHGYIVEIIARPDTPEDAKELEMLLISEYGRIDLGTGSLVNQTGGGDGGLNPSEERLAVLRESMIGNSYSKGNKMTDEFKRKVSEFHKGKKVPREVVDRIRKSQSKPVQRFSMDGVFEKEYEFLNTVTEDGYSKGNVCMCCKGQRNHHGGKIWKYKHDVTGN